MSRSATFPELRDELAAILSRIRYSTMTTVDRQGRPRSRVLIAVWELAGDEPVGWLGTFRTPVKAAHLANNPHATFAYWDQRQDTATIDTVAQWTDDPAERRHVWRLYQQGAPRGVGYPPEAYWPGGPDSAAFQVLRLEPYRIQILHGRELAQGTPARIWRPARSPIAASVE
jgi:general stress protein 26